MNKKLCLLILFLMFICPITYTYELDTSINKEIEQKYNSDKLNQDMQINKTTNKVPKSQISSKKAPKSTPIFDNSTINITKNNTKAPTKTITSKEGIKLPSGTKFTVKSNVNISSWSGVNSLLSFTSTAPVYVTYVTIPAGTTFKGVISASHRGQITGNGGLIKIKITSMNLNGKTVPVEGKITKANSKNVFFNNIKGARQYLQGVDNKINQGINFYKKARNISAKMSSNPVGTVLSPIPTITGWLGSAVYTITSPVTGLTQKGKNISLPSGTLYEIKLIEDAYIN